MTNEDKFTSKISSFLQQKGFGWIIEVEEENEYNTSLL